MFVAAMLALRDLPTDAADEILFWARTVRGQPLSHEALGLPPIAAAAAGSSHGDDVINTYRNLTMVFAYNWAGIFSNFEETPHLDILASREAARHVDAILESNYRLNNLFKMALTASGDQFKIDGRCGVHNPSDARPVTSPRSKRTIDGLNLLLRLYISNINNLIYYQMHTPEIFTDHENTIIEHRYLEPLKKFDFDCAFELADPNRIFAIFVADTFVRAKIYRAQMALHGRPMEVQQVNRIACELGEIRDAVHTLARDQRIANASLPRSKGAEEIAYGDWLAEERTHREAREALVLAENVVAEIDRMLSHASGSSLGDRLFSDWGFRKDYKDTCLG